MPNQAQSMTLGRLQQLNAALAANAAGLPNLEPQRQQFAEMVAQTLEALTRQDALTAEKQEASQTLLVRLTEAARHANVLRLALKAHYGIRSEKLAEFGIKTFRGRKPAPVVPPEPEPEIPGPTVE